MDYFQTLFTASDQRGFFAFLENLAGKVTDIMNEKLPKEYTKDEVYKVLQYMNPTKALGLEGVAFTFFQKFSHITNKSITVAVLKALNSGEISHSINHTFITLIPKKKSPIKVTDFRLISLCNVIYKLISKVIVNRLKLVIPFIIYDSQSVFVPGKLIINNVLIAYELIHYLWQKRIGKKRFHVSKIRHEQSL